jgi:hypothetical protein
MLFFVTGGDSFCSGLGAPEVLAADPRYTALSRLHIFRRHLRRPTESGGVMSRAELIVLGPGEGKTVSVRGNGYTDEAVDRARAVVRASSR